MTAAAKKAETSILGAGPARLAVGRQGSLTGQRSELGGAGRVDDEVVVGSHRRESSPVPLPLVGIGGHHDRRAG